MAISKKHLQQFKKQLAEEKKELEEELKKHSTVPDFGSGADADQESGESQAFGSQLSVSLTFKNRLADIDLALNKIKEGKYGVCEQCRQEISLEVLKISPESKLCQRCKISEGRFSRLYTNIKTNFKKLLRRK